MFASVSGKGQKDSIGFKRWEIGTVYNWDHLFYIEQMLPHGHSGYYFDWIYRGDFNQAPRNYIGYGAYFKYKISNFFSLSSQIYYKQLKINPSGCDSRMKYKDSLYYPLNLWYYEFQSIEIPIYVTMSFCNKFFINPYISGGFTNNICVFEKALIVNNNNLEFYKCKHWEYYSFRFRYGGGVDITIKKRVRFGCDIYINVKPLWQTDKTMITGIEYSNFSIGVHAGYLIK